MNFCAQRLSAIRIRVGLLLALLFLGNSTALEAGNVLLIIADDLGAESVGTFTDLPTAPTPTLDALASGGVRFTNCWANPICSPTRASILTGRHGFRTGVGSPGAPLQIDEFTLAHAFSEAGYATACIGKWHLSGSDNGGADHPNLAGFHHFAGSLSGGMQNYYSWNKVVNGETESVDNYATTENVNDALDWIEIQEDNPWFMWLAFNAPHAPFHLPPNELHGYDLSGSEEDIRANSLQYYQATVEAIDTEIGRLLASMDPEVRANTTVIFVGDNGTPGRVSNRAVAGSKGSLLAGGVHVPCIVNGPGVVGGEARTHDALIHMTDMFATFLEIADIDIETVTPTGAAVDSLSFAPYLASPELENFHAYQFTESFNDDEPTLNNGKAISDGVHKFIAYDSGAQELFLLPDETTNLLENDLSEDDQEAYDRLMLELDTLLATQGEEISYDSFENTWGTFEPNGATFSRRHATDGRRSANLQSDDTSFQTANALDFSGFDSVEIDFTFQLQGMDADEGFVVEYFDGTSWSIVGQYLTDEHENDTTYDGTIVLHSDDRTLSDSALLRFVSVADHRRDDAYIDQVRIVGK